MDYIDRLFNLKGKIAVITGGGGVLASTIGSGMAEAGIKVVLLDINLQACNKVADSINQIGADAIGMEADVLDSENLQIACSKIIEKYGRIDILLNAAGGNMPGASINDNQTIFDLRIEDLDKVTNLNFKGTVLPSLIFGKEMAKQRSGCIINISSMAALQSITRQVGYSASKAAVSNFTIWMAMEMALKFDGKIRVNAIAPGFFIGNQNRALLIDANGDLTDRSRKIIAKTPMRRFGEAHELTGAVLFLASDAASFITGVVMPVDGGFSTFSGV